MHLTGPELLWLASNWTPKKGKNQGRMLSMWRSVAVEEAAARAGVLMILPMVLLVSAILLLLMGFRLVNGIGR